MKLWKPSPEEREHLECVMGMSMDCIMGNGVDKLTTYTSNLRMIADKMEKVFKVE
jgi:hypothetical protein